MIISFVNQKGGVGKSTLSFHLACWLQSQGLSVSFYDGDIQRSSSAWLQASCRDIPHGVINPDDPNSMPGEILALGENADITICDGPGGLGEATRTLLVLSDIALFPIQPSLLDAHSLLQASQQLRYAASLTPGRTFVARALLNRVRKRSRRARATRAAEEHLGLPILAAAVRDLDAFREAADAETDVWQLKGRGALDAARDLEALFDEVLALATTQQRVAAHG